MTPLPTGTSALTVWAQRWARDHLDLRLLREGWTYLFEIIYSKHQIVIEYGFEGLVLLAIYDNDGAELDAEYRSQVRPS